MAELLIEEGYELGVIAIKIVDADGNVIYTLPVSTETFGVIDVITEDGFNMITDTDEDKIILEYVVASNPYNENLDSLYIGVEAGTWHK